MQFNAFEVLHNANINQSLVALALDYLQQHQQSLLNNMKTTPVGYVLEGFNPIFNDKVHYLLVKQLNGAILIELHQKNIIDYSCLFYLAIPHGAMTAPLNTISLSYKLMV